MVDGTREGWLLAWKTGFRVGDLADWPEYGHDPWNTGCLGTDARRPGRMGDLAAEPVLEDGDLVGVELIWTAPGDDGRLGRDMCHEVRFMYRSLDGNNWDEAASLAEETPSALSPARRRRCSSH